MTTTSTIAIGIGLIMGILFIAYFIFLIGDFIRYLRIKASHTKAVAETNRIKFWTRLEIFCSKRATIRRRK